MNIKELIEQNKNDVTVRITASDPSLRVLKYKKHVFFKDLWNPFLEECRGLVLDEDYNIVSYPFTKIYNYGIEANAPVFADDEPLLCLYKVNGFMVSCTWHKEDLLWATTGTIDSEFVGYAKDMFSRLSEEAQAEFKKVLASMPNYTFMFECVHPQDPHIVEELQGLWFLGLRKKELGSRVLPFLSEMQNVDGIHFPGRNYDYNINDIKELAKTWKGEGFVIYAQDGRAAKIKSPHYLTKKMLMRSNMDRLMAANAKELLDEEFYPLLRWIQEVEREKFAQLDEVARREFIENWFIGNSE